MTEEVWSVAWPGIVTGGMMPQQATDKALKRVAAILAKYPIQQA
jgi:hypothetical protein